MQHNTTTIPNYHILLVKYLPYSGSKDSRISIRSARFKETKVIDFTSDGGNTLEQAEVWLLSNGFEVVGHGEAKDGFYIVTSTFEPLHKK